MIDAFDSVYGIYDSVAEAESVIYDFKFRMSVVKKDEIFNKFYARFLSSILILEYSDVQNIFCMKRNLINKFRIKIANGIKITVFEKLVRRYR
jgi:hypothetical protein